MNDDKYIGIEVLTDVLSHVTEMVDQRTTLLNSMFKEDLYNDFLMQEAMQGGMGGAGIDNVSPVGNSYNYQLDRTIQDRLQKTAWMALRKYKEIQ